MVDECTTGGCTRPGIATAHFVDGEDDEYPYCRDCIIRQQTRGDPPDAVTWASDVEVDLNP